MSYRVDLNSDLGESFGAFTIGNDFEIMQWITSANIACGYHAGDHNMINKTIKMAEERKLGIGAHPGLPDLMGFGRRYLEVGPDEVYNLIVYQLGAMQAFAKIHNTVIHHVKPHGALYNMANQSEAIAVAIVRAVRDINPTLILFGLSGSILTRIGRETGLRVAEEVFADRTYQSDGTLTPRSNANALITDPDVAVKRVTRMVREGKVESIDGNDIPIKADTICIHGDGEHSLSFVRTLHEQLIKSNISIKRFE